MIGYILGFFTGFIVAELVFLAAVWYDNNGRR